MELYGLKTPLSFSPDEDVREVSMKYYMKSMIKACLLPLTKRLRYSIRYGDVRLKLRGGLDFLRFKSFDQEEQFLCNLDLKEKIIYDVGSHIGILTIFFAKKCGGVE